MYNYINFIVLFFIFCVQCIPCHSPCSESIAPRGASKGGVAVPVMTGDTGRLEEMVAHGEGRATLRLKKDGQAVVEEVVSIVFTYFVE